MPASFVGFQIVQECEACGRILSGNFKCKDGKVAKGKDGLCGPCYESLGQTMEEEPEMSLEEQFLVDAF